jgi:hypothetical protein
MNRFVIPRLMILCNQNAEVSLQASTTLEPFILRGKKKAQEMHKAPFLRLCPPALLGKEAVNGLKSTVSFLRLRSGQARRNGLKGLEAVHE